jgi:transposase
MHQVLRTIEDEVNSRPSGIEFEIAYQARVAIDRIRFAIKHTEQFYPRSDPMRETGLQLLEALERLEAVDRGFQERSRISRRTRRTGTERTPENGEGTKKEILS